MASATPDTPGSVPAQVVTRFAPSPTGYLHVGGARTALFNWLLARHHGGRYLLRIEDTDLARSTETAAVQLLEDLRWLGLHWDNAELVYQSKRLDAYDRVVDDLIARGLAYRAYETNEELDAMRKDAERRKQQFVYRGAPLPPGQVAKYEAEGRVPVVRFVMPATASRFTDLVLGENVQAGHEADHFIIRKSDGTPTFHLAVVVDDAAMGVTLVMRGQEHLKNTHRHIALQEVLGYPRPAYAHLTTILNPDDTKMGKRDRDKVIRERAQERLKATAKSPADLALAAKLPGARVAEWLTNKKSQLDFTEQAAVMHVVGLREADLPEIFVHDFRKNGYLPEVLLNFVALLGWSPGGDRERMTVAEMVQLFGLDRVLKSNPKFNRDKLLAFNTEAVAAASPGRLVAAFKDYLSVNPESPLNEATDEQLARLLAMKKGFRLLREVDEISRFFFLSDDAIAYDPDAVEKTLRKAGGQGLGALRDVRHVLETITHWTAAGLEGAVKTYCDQKGLGLGKVAQPLRVAISGTTVSPPIFESLEFLGRERTMARIDRCLAAA